MTDTEVVHHPLDGLKFGGIRLGFFDGDSLRFLAITRRIFRVNQCSSKIGTVSNPLIETAESSRILGISCFFFLLFFLLLFLCFIHLFCTDRWSAILNCQVPIEANRWFHSLIKNDSIQVFASLCLHSSERLIQLKRRHFVPGDVIHDVNLVNSFDAFLSALTPALTTLPSIPCPFTYLDCLENIERVTTGCQLGRLFFWFISNFCQHISVSEKFLKIGRVNVGSYGLASIALTSFLVTYFIFKNLKKLEWTENVCRSQCWFFQNFFSVFKAKYKWWKRDQVNVACYGTGVICITCRC